jgi:transcriptional regulator with XRE-family HTH domain
MDAQRFGATLRAVRMHRQLRQADVAQLARVSDATVSRIERGHLASVAVGTALAVAAALEVNVDLRAWTRAGDLDRLVNRRHAALAEDVVAALVVCGWVVRPELSFNERGERGFVDILASHPAFRALLAVEIKTELVDVGEALGTLDRKRRLAPRLAAIQGWTSPASVSVALILGESRTNRRRVAEHAATIRSVLPDDGRQLRSLLRHPSTAIAALAYWPVRHPGTAGPGWSAVRRVRRPERGAIRARRPSRQGAVGRTPPDVAS